MGQRTYTEDIEVTWQEVKIPFTVDFQVTEGYEGDRDEPPSGVEFEVVGISSNGVDCFVHLKDEVWEDVNEAVIEAHIETLASNQEDADVARYEDCMDYTNSQWREYD